MWCFLRAKYWEILTVFSFKILRPASSAKSFISLMNRRCVKDIPFQQSEIVKNIATTTFAFNVYKDFF